jgi:hypothetical protein
VTNSELLHKCKCRFSAVKPCHAHCSNGPRAPGGPQATAAAHHTVQEQQVTSLHTTQLEWALLARGGSSVPGRGPREISLNGRDRQPRPFGRHGNIETCNSRPPAPQAKRDAGEEGAAAPTAVESGGLLKRVAQVSRSIHRWESPVGGSKGLMQEEKSGLLAWCCEGLAACRLARAHMRRTRPHARCAPA